MSILKSPFNFVPFSEKVCTVDWAEQVSHDIPFSDGECGSIEITIENETPLFVSDGKKDKDNSAEILKFSQAPDGRYFIPGSSLKGEIRNILEILSFGKARIDTSAAFARRDLRDNKVYPLMKNQQNIRCGYLFYDKEASCYIIEDHNKPYRIGHDEIENYIESIDSSKRRILSKYFCKIPRERGCEPAANFNLNKAYKLNNDDFDPKSATFKYELLKNIPLEGLAFNISEKSTEMSTRLKYDPYGEIIGDIVLTGQPSPWVWPRPTKQGGGKFYEFVFPSEVAKDLIPDGQFKLSEDEFNNYKFIYSESPDWKRCKQLLDSTGIPVFFQAEGKNIKNFGLAFLYKLPYNNTPYDLLPKKYTDENVYDLAETIFGYTSKIKSLKGRVQFSHLFSDNAKEGEMVQLTLNGPKASYYPLYIKQNGGEYNTYDNGALAGRKRYVVRDSVWGKSTSDKLDTKFIPIDKGAIFKGKVFFHNLRAVEIGALLSALTFHNTECCRHMIGMAKPYGYGRVKISVSATTLERETDYYLYKFEDFVSKTIPDWSESAQIRELFSLATPVKHSQKFEYMNLSLDKNGNEFEQAKNAKESLNHHTTITSNRVTPKSIYDAYKEKESERIDLIIEEEVQKAQKLLEQNLFDEAIKTLKEIAKRYEKNLDEQIKHIEAPAIEYFTQKARELEEQKEYDSAIDVYKSIQEKYSKICFNDIERCEKAKQVTNCYSIADGFTLNAIGSCANWIRKWKGAKGEITESDAIALATAIKTQLPNKKKQDQKIWRDYKNWGPIKRDAGEELAKKMFDIIDTIN